MGSLLDLKRLDFHLHSVYCNTAKIGRYQDVRRDHCEMVYKLNGYSTQVFPAHGLTIGLIPDSIYIIPAFTDNSYEVTENGTVVNIVFDLIGGRSPEPLLPELIALPADNPYKSLFLRTAKIWGEHDRSVYCRCHAIVSEIFAGLIADREKQYLESGRYAVIAPAVDYVRQNYREAISVSGLAKMCGISDEYLRRLFRSFVGQTPLRYVNNLRLSYARELLLDNRMSVAQAAAEAGFDNVNYFSRIFKERYHIPPSRADSIVFTDPYRKENSHDTDH